MFIFLLVYWLVGQTNYLMAKDWVLIKNFQKASFEDLFIWSEEKTVWGIDSSFIFKVDLEQSRVINRWSHQIGHIEGACFNQGKFYIYDGCAIVVWDTKEAKKRSLFQFKTNDKLMNIKSQGTYVYLLFHSKIVRWSSSNKQIDVISTRFKFSDMEIAFDTLFLANGNEILKFNAQTLKVVSIVQRGVHLDTVKQEEKGSNALLRKEERRLVWLTDNAISWVTKKGKIEQTIQYKVNSKTEEGLKGVQKVGGDYFLSFRKSLFHLNNQEKVLREMNQLPFARIYSVGKGGVLSVVSQRGVWVLIEVENRMCESQSCREPSFREVMNKVLEYQRLQPERIQSWGDQIRRRGCYPQVSISLDYERNELNEIYTSLTRSFLYEADPENEFSATIRLTWDLADVAFPTGDMVSWDTRKRLDIQLREDMLTEVSRIYYQRKKALAEMKKKKKKGIEKQQLLIEELTSLLDIYTGGWFSQVCSENP